MPSTEIILTENIPGLGRRGGCRQSAPRLRAQFSFADRARLYEVTKRSLRQLDNLKAKRAEREARELNEAEELARRIGKLKVDLHPRDR